MLPCTWWTQCFLHKDRLPKCGQWSKWKECRHLKSVISIGNRSSDFINCCRRWFHYFLQHLRQTSFTVCLIDFRFLLQWHHQHHKCFSCLVVALVIESAVVVRSLPTDFSVVTSTVSFAATLCVTCSHCPVNLAINLALSSRAKWRAGSTRVEQCRPKSERGLFLIRWMTGETRATSLARLQKTQAPVANSKLQCEIITVCKPTDSHQNNSNLLVGRQILLLFDDDDQLAKINIRKTVGLSRFWHRNNLCRTRPVCAIK